MKRFLLLCLVVSLFGACTPQGVVAVDHPIVTPGESVGSIELVESWPLETTLDHKDIADAADVWLDMLGRAEKSLELSEFYLVTSPESKLEPILAAVEAAAERGVKVRILVDLKFYGNEPALVDRLSLNPAIALQKYDVGALMGGVQHSKYFIVDGKEVYMGSQNFDWRSLEHIHEMGVHLRSAELARPFVELFAADWALASGTPKSALPPVSSPYTAPLVADFNGVSVEVTPVFSPKGWLVDEATWDLPQIIALIDAAKTRVRVQVMSYSTSNYDKTTFFELDEALRRAAARGVKVELMVADWSKKAYAIKMLVELQAQGADVKLVTIPQFSGGFIPFARVIHSKYMTVDDHVSWIGTSNWSGDYFYQSRNVGLIVEGAAFTQSLDVVFNDLWSSSYAETLDPNATYEAPRIKE